MLEASTAAELALRQLLDIRLAGLDVDIAEALSKGTREMGRLVDLLNEVGVGLPGRLKEGLLNVRNRAIHRGEEPTIDEAREVLRLAGVLVDRAVPRRHLLHD
ncbi:MAG: hypothetical protein QM747_15385 [Nocardioides sp.]